MTKKCYYTCNSGYVLVGKPAKSCRRTQEWNPADTPICQEGANATIFHTLVFLHSDYIRFPSFADIPEPFIQCPDDVEQFLGKGESSVEVSIAKPISNMDDSNVLASPEWAVARNASFPAGMNEVTFVARNPITNQTAACITSVNIKGELSEDHYLCLAVVGTHDASRQGS